MKLENKSNLRKEFNLFQHMLPHAEYQWVFSKNSSDAVQPFDQL